VACGPGEWARQRRRCGRGDGGGPSRGMVLVLTVDPARRLADALGLEGIGNTEKRVPDETFLAAGVKPMGELWAAMLDTKGVWDSLSAARAGRAHPGRDPLQPPDRNISSRSSRATTTSPWSACSRSTRTQLRPHSSSTPAHAAMHSTSRLPRAHGGVFSSRLLRWLIVPYRSKLVNFGFETLLPGRRPDPRNPVPRGVAQFFILFQSMYDGFVERAASVHRLMADRRTSFIVVSSSRTVPLREAEFFAQASRTGGSASRRIVPNKVLPAYLRDPQGRGRRRETA